MTTHRVLKSVFRCSCRFSFHAVSLVATLSLTFDLFSIFIRVSKMHFSVLFNSFLLFSVERSVGSTISLRFDYFSILIRVSITNLATIFHFFAFVFC